MKRWQTVVIGGGLAGCAAAIRLAQNGQQVLLLEKEATAHDKVCGEFISSEAQNYLHELGLDLLSLGAVPISTIRLMKGQKIAAAKLPFPAFSLSRRILDEAMMLRAEQHGAHVMRAVEAGEIVRAPQGWRVTIKGHDTILAEAVFLATGKHELRGWHRQGGIQNDFIGFKMHFRMTELQKAKLAEHVDLTLFDGGYAGLELVEDGKANLCLVVTKRHFSMYGKSWDGLLKAIQKATPLLAERLRGAEPCWTRPLSIFGIPYGFMYRPLSAQPTSLYRLGDQLAVIPSFCGYGMSIALHTAFLAVKCYLHSDANAYHRQARDDLQSLIQRTTLLSKIAEHAFAQEVMLLACRHRPKLISRIVLHNRISNSVYSTEA